MKKTSLISTIVAVILMMQLPVTTVIAGNISKSTTSILKFQLLLAEKGNAEAQFKLASMYEFGVGTKKDLSTARDWYAQAISNGSAEANDRLIYIDIREKGFNKKSHAQWLDKIKKGTDSGNQHFAMLLGQLYSYGIGVKKDLDESIRLLNLAGVYENPVVVYELERVEKEKNSLVKQRYQQQEVKQAPQPVQQQVVKIKQEAEKTSQPAPEVLSKAEIAAKKKADEMAEKRRRYEEVMRKLREEQRIIDEQQAWAEGK